MNDDRRDVADSIGFIRESSARHLEQRAAALAWRDSLTVPCSLLWLPQFWLHEPGQTILRDSLLPKTLLRKLQASRADTTGGLTWKVLHRATQEVAARVVLDELLHTDHRLADSCGIFPDLVRDSYLQHSALGAPKARLRGAPLRAFRSAGMNCRDLHISFTHDGGAHVAIAACAPGLRGLGVDMVHLPRLLRPKKDMAYLHRFAQAFMSEFEWENYVDVSRGEDSKTLAARTAAHFSLMEAASKALGTGLRIGGGMGKPESLPKRSLNVLNLEPKVTFDLGAGAKARCAALNASHLAAYWAADDEYLVSLALLWER